MDKYSWSFDEYAELWSNSANSIEECIANAKAEAALDEDQQCVYIGKNDLFIPYIDGVSVLEQIEEAAYELAGEAAEHWDTYDRHKLSEVEELSESLTNVITAWLEKYGRTPRFYRVDQIKKYPLNVEVQGGTETA